MDIRRFLKPVKGATEKPKKATAGEASRDKEQDKEPSKEKPPPAKRTAAAAAKSPKAAKRSSPAKPRPAKRPPAGKAGSPAAKKKPSAAAEAKPAKQKKRKVADDGSDSDFVVDADHSDGDDEDAVVDVDADEEDVAVDMDAEAEEEELEDVSNRPGRKRSAAAVAAPAASPAKRPRSGRKSTTSAPARPGSSAKSSQAVGAQKAEAAAGSRSTPARGPRGRPAASSPAAGKAARKQAGPELSAKAKLAIAAVDKALQSLKPPDQSSYSVMDPGAAGGGFGAGPNAGETPPNHGSKDLPRGHSDCLTGKTFVLTGVLDSLTRQEAEDFVRRHNGRITGSVSSRTTCVVVGQNCGNSKMAKARTHKTRLIDEDGLISLVQAAVPFAEDGVAEPEGADRAGVTAALREAGQPPQGPGESMSAPPARPSSSSHAAASATRDTVSGPAGRGPPGAGAELWVDKHKPLSSQALVGNGGHIRTLTEWLRQWHDIHLRGQQPAWEGKGRGGGRVPDLSKRAVLLSGAPGIGKTTSALIISRELGFEPVEMNASDTRNKADPDSKRKQGMNGKMSNVIKEMATNTAIGRGDGRIGSRRQVLIMDEVDGMSGGDRGGTAELIETIKRSKVPIICICNDKYNQKLKSLRNHCLELDFSKPNRQAVAKRMLDIAHREGLQVNAQAMDALVESCNGDIRMILGQLQMVAQTRPHVVLPVS